MAIPPDPKTAKAAAPTTSGKLTYTIAPGSKAAPAKPAAAPSAAGGSLFDVASSRAATETDALVAGYRQLQDYANQQAALRAAQQGQLGLAASKYLEGLDLPGRTTADYAAAADAQRAAAQGYSGGLQQTVSDAAAQVQANLAAGGSPQTVYNPGQAAGNALYALGGTLPATQFGVTGPTVAAGLRALPAQALGYGQQLAFGELGQGQQEAAKFNADIATARAKQGALAGSYMDTLLAAQQDAQDAAALNAYRQGQLKISAFKANAAVDYQNTKLNLDAAKAQAQVDYQNARLTNDTARIKETAAHNTALETLAQQNADNLTAYRNDQISLATFNANTSRINSATSRINANTSRINANKPPSPSDTAQTAPPRLHAGNSNALGIRTDQYGDPINYGTKTKPRYVLMPGWKWGPGGMPVKKGGGGGGTAGISPTSYAGLKKDAGAAMDLLYYGDADKGIEGVNYQQAINRLVTQYSLKRKDAITLANQYYAPGEDGRPAMSEGFGGGGDFGPSGGGYSVPGPK